MNNVVLLAAAILAAVPLIFLAYLSLTDPTPDHVFPAQLRDAHAFLGEIHRGLGTLSDRPVLLPWGMKDFAFQAPERSRFESLFPDHETILLENAGHFIQEDTPIEIAAAIRDWHERNF